MTARQRGSACFGIRPLRLEEWARLGAPWARVRLAVMEAETIAEFGASAVAFFDLPADDPGQFDDGCRAGRALAQAGQPLPIDIATDSTPWAAGIVAGYEAVLADRNQPQPGRVTPAQAAAAIFTDPFITDPCREGTHDCRFSGCKCPGHRRTRRGTYCTLRGEQDRGE